MNNQIKITAARHPDIPAVLVLQSKYLVTNMNEEEKKQGFVTTPFTAEQLKKVIDLDGLFVAKTDERVVGYAFGAGWDYFEQWPIFPFMTNRFIELPPFKGIQITGANSFQYGPICIDTEFRGSGLLNHLFEAMRLGLRERFPISVTFINKINERSVQAHTRKLDWEIIDEFSFNNNHYFMLAFDMHHSVLK